MRITLILLLAGVLLSGSNCKKDKNGNAIEIQGFAVVDALGNPITEIGSASDDWKVYNSLSPSEMALFDFNTTLTLANTVEASITRTPVAYPNPFVSVQSYAVGVSDSVLLKIVVVNERLEVLNTAAFKIKGMNAFTVDYTDRVRYPNKAALRVYYSFSAQGKPNYKVGYGDIKVCELQGGASFMDCF